MNHGSVLRYLEENPDIDYRMFFYRVARKYPDIALDILERSLQDRVIELLKGNKKIEAIKMVKGVQDVVPAIADRQTYWARESARRELEERLWKALREVFET